LLRGAANLGKVEIAAVGQQAFDLHEVGALVGAAEADSSVNGKFSDI
jgi:uncharacterized protein involved in high-affinity Fe2+ transport